MPRKCGDDCRICGMKLIEPKDEGDVGETFACMVECCQRRFSSVDVMHRHMRMHVNGRAEGDVPAAYLSKYKRVQCAQCNDILAASNATEGCHLRCHQQRVMAEPPSRPIEEQLDTPAPASFVATESGADHFDSNVTMLQISRVNLSLERRVPPSLRGDWAALVTAHCSAQHGAPQASHGPLRIVTRSMVPRRRDLVLAKRLYRRDA